MAQIRYKDEDEIVGILKQKVFGSDSYNQSELAKQRQDSMNMYYLNPLGNEMEGTSQIQSSEVFDAVEGTKGVMHEALTSGRELLYFEPMNDQDDDLSRMATRYVQDRFRENNGYRFMIDSLHDGLLTKNAICKYYWLEDKEERLEPFVGLNDIQLAGALQDPELEVAEIQSFQAADGDLIYSVHSGTFVRTIDKSRIAFTLVKPEDFFGDETAETDEDFTFASDREVMRKGELIEDYPHLEKEIMDAPMYWDSRREQDNLVRRSNDDSWRTESQSEKATERDPVEVHDCYIYLWGDKGYGIYRYKMLAQKYLLWEWPVDEMGEPLPELMEEFDPASGELVDDIPYLVWSPYPLAHRWDGLSQADGVRDLQLTATNLKRSMVDHTLRTNNPMREANLEFIRNPRDLIDNVIGAVLDKEMPAGTGPVVTAVDQPMMSSTSFSTLEMVKQESEQRSSYSRLAGGLNNDAIAKQNSRDMIQDLTDASNRRIMMMTRNYVELFFKKLWLRIYKLGVQNDTKTYQVQLNGNWVEMSPSQWPERTDMKVVTSLTPTAAIQEAMNKIAWHNLVVQDPEAMLLYPEDRRYNLYAEVLRDIGEVAVDRFLINPDSEEFRVAQMGILQQQQQQAMQQQQAQERQIGILDRQIQLQEFSTMANIDQGQQKIDNDAMYNADKQSLDEDEFEHKVEIDKQELNLESKKISKNSDVSGVSIG